MKKIVVFIIFTLLISNVNIYAEEISLAEFDGLTNEILGPMEVPVPKSYFTKDLSPKADENELYYTSFKIKTNEMHSTSLVLNNTLQDNMPYPVVLSIKYPGKQFHNYILKFGDSSEITVDLSYEADYMTNHSKVEVSIFCDFPFSGEVYQKGSLLKELELIEPNIISDAEPEAMLLSTSLPCCASTGTIKKLVWLKSSATGECAYAWISISRGSCSGYTFIRCYGELTCYYPNKTSAFHEAVAKTSTGYYCEYQPNPYSPDTCIAAQLYHYTENDVAQHMEHRWYNMRQVISDYNYTGSVTVMVGGNTGNTWTVSQSFCN